MNQVFENIRITGLDISLTQPSPTASGLRLLHLELSATPPADWVEFFNRERSFHPEFPSALKNYADSRR